MLVSKFSEGGECFEVQGSPESLTEVMEQLAAVFPSIVRPMITERDEYMAVRLRMLAPKCGPLQRLQGLHEGCWGGGVPTRVHLLHLREASVPLAQPKPVLLT